MKLSRDNKKGGNERKNKKKLKRSQIKVDMLK